MWRDVREKVLRFLGIFRRNRIEDEMSEELAFHLAMRREKYAKNGEADAAEHARRDLGSVQKWKEATRDVQRPRWLEDFIRDLMLGARMLRKTPAFTTVALLTLALAIGANTAIFSLMNALLLRPLPVPQADRLVVLRLQPAVSGYSFCAPLFRYLESHAQVFSDVFAVAYHSFQFRGAEGTERIDGVLVSGRYFSGLRVSPELGRYLNPGDDQPGGGPQGPVVVISDRLWRARFGGDPAVVGRKLVLDKVAFSVAGVAPPSFNGTQVGARPDLFVPLATEPLVNAPFSSTASGWRAWWLQVSARLRDGVSVVQADSFLKSSSQMILNASIPDSRWEYGPHKRSEVFLAAESGATGYTYLRFRFLKPLTALLVLVGVVLLIACLNLATLLMARSAARNREMAARFALGASRGRLLRQLLTESLLLALAGTLFGSSVSPLLSRGLLLFLSSPRDPLYFDVAPDLRVLAFTGAIAILATVLTGVAPALRSTGRALEQQIREGSGTIRAADRRNLFPRVLLGMEISLAMVLVAGAGLLGYSLLRLHEAPTGFDPRGLVLLPLEMSKQSRNGDALIQSYKEIAHGLAEAPGATDVSYVMLPPISNMQMTTDVNLPGQPAKEVFTNVAAARYFRAMRTPLIAGREFEWSDTTASGRVVILNQAAARLLFPNGGAIGHEVRADGTTYRVVGIVGDTKYTSLRNAAEPTMYQPLTQNANFRQSYVAIVRVSGAPAAVIAGAQAIVRRVAPEIPQPAATTMDDRISESLSTERIMAALALFFGGVALLITAIGLYGALAYATARRTGEIGIRMTLGARAGNILAMVCRENIGIALSGCIAGLAISLVALRWISSFLYNTSPRNPIALAGAAVALLTVAAVASYLPASRASRIDPMAAIRHE